MNKQWRIGVVQSYMSQKWPKGYGGANTLIIPRLGRLRLEDHEFKSSMGYIVGPCLKSREIK